jgi:hypothetical protein
LSNHPKTARQNRIAEDEFMQLPDFDVGVEDTIFRPDAPQRARDYFLKLFGRLDSKWLNKPVGPIGRLWGAPGCELELVNLARVLDTVERNITQRSVPEFEGKVRELLRLPEKFNRLFRYMGERAHVDTMAELEFIALVSERASPICLAPLVPAAQFASANRPRSPDLGLRLPDGDVAIDVTVLYPHILTVWHESGDYLSNAITEGVKKASATRSAQLRIDLGFNYREVPDSQIRELVRQVVDRGEGTVSLTTQRDIRADVSWQTMPVFSSPNDAGKITQNLSSLPEGWTAAVFGGATAAFHRSLDVRRDELIEEPLYRSLWKKLKAKRQQYRLHTPFFVAIRPGHPMLRQEWILSVLELKVWPNYDFKRITGVLIHVPRLSFQKTCQGDQIIASLNPNAASPASPAFLDMLEGKKRFILR